MKNKRILQLTIYGIVSWLALTQMGCSQFSSGFTVKPIATKTFSVTKSITIIEQEPDKPYMVVADFSGQELKNCNQEEPLCSLQKQAREIGADAIWIKQHEVQQSGGRWILVQGKMTQIYPYRNDIYRGVLIRYLD